MQRSTRRKTHLILCALLVCCATAPRAAAEITIDADYPGGNIVFERIEGDHVYLHQELRDTPIWWFYWNFRVTGAAGRDLTFHFTNGDVIDLQGPAMSLDEGGTWEWLGSGSVSGASFSHTFGAEADSVRFCYAIPYQEADLAEFLAGHEGHPHLAEEVLCRDRSGRIVERLRLGKLDGEPQHRVALTCRHHSCEMMSSWVLEGILAAILADDDDGRWFQQNVEVVAVPFMDKDGVEDGDQGKARAPHDHNEDYAGEPLYPTVCALKNFLPGWSQGKLRIALDLHCPYIHWPDIYWVLVPDEPYQANTRAFLTLLADIQEGPLTYTYSPANTVVWPPTSPPIGTKNFGWSMTLPGMEVPTSLELPYSTNAGVPVTPDNARAFGRDIARAIREYLIVSVPPPVSADPGALFGDLTSLGGNPGPQVETVTISNDSSGAVDLGTPGITGADSGLYQVTSGPTQDPIPAGGTADIEVTFTSPAQGGIFQASLEIPTDHPQVPAVVVELDALVSLALPLHESFETEALGAFDGIADQTWTLGAAVETIEDKDLSYSGGDITVDSGARVLKISSLGAVTSPVVRYDFDSQSGPVYFSFLAQITGTPLFQPWVGNSSTGDHAGSAHITLDNAYSPNHVKGTLCRATDYNTVHTADLADAVDQTVFIVARLSKSGAAGDNYDRLELMVNPTSMSEPATWDGSLTHDIQVTNLDRFGIRYGSDQSAWIDEIRIGTSWAQVLPGPPSLRLAVETSGSDLVFTWASRAGRRYDLLSATGLDTPPDSPWPVYTDTASTTHEDIPASGTGANTLTVPRDPADSVRFFALREEPVP